MTLRADILSLFTAERRKGTLYLPDLTLWYEWHQLRGTLPVGWKDYSLPQVARAMDVPIWFPFAPWRVESRGVEIVTTEEHGERTIRWETSIGALVSRWTLGPDGDWWQVEYPVKSVDDLQGVLEIVQARTYVLHTGELKRWEDAVGEDGVLALEIPRRPYSDLLHQFLGWSEGLLFLRDPLVDEINAVLERKLQALVQEIAPLPGEVAFSADNLDAQFISPKAFKTYLEPSYRRTVDALRQHRKHLVVHIGGPIGRLLGPLVEAGVEGFEGIAGPPQGDLTLMEARQAAGSAPLLWGGIPQDYLLDTREREEFEMAVKRAVAEVQGDQRAILGVADRVPAGADLSRLQAISELIAGA